MTATARFSSTTISALPAAKPTIALAEHQAKLAEAEAQGYRKGHAAAEAKAQAEAAQKMPALLANVAAAIEALRKSASALEARLETEAVEVAVAIATKLAPALIAREPFAEIAALVDEAFRHLVDAPHVVVRLSETLYGEAQPLLAETARARGFEGRLVVLADPEIAPGDCRIEWADGGVTRDRAATEAAIADLVERYLAARRASTATFRPSRPTWLGDLNHDRHHHAAAGPRRGSDMTEAERKAPAQRRRQSTSTAAPPISKPCSTSRCRSLPCSAAHAWMSAIC